MTVIKPNSMTVFKKILLALWLIFLATVLSLFIFNRPFLEGTLHTLLSTSTTTAYIVLFLLGIFRGFTLIPVTFLILVGLLFIPAIPLYFIIMSGVLVSSASVYYFFEYLNLETLFTAKHKKLLDRGSALLNKYELPVITLWSMAPFLSTDVIVYLAGVLRVNVYTCLLGVLIGEGTICALYIWGGTAILHSTTLM